MICHVIHTRAPVGASSGWTTNPELSLMTPHSELITCFVIFDYFPLCSPHLPPCGCQAGGRTWVAVNNQKQNLHLVTGNVLFVIIYFWCWEILLLLRTKILVRWKSLWCLFDRNLSSLRVWNNLQKIEIDLYLLLFLTVSLICAFAFFA